MMITGNEKMVLSQRLCTLQGSLKGDRSKECGNLSIWETYIPLRLIFVKKV